MPVRVLFAYLGKSTGRRSSGQPPMAQRKRDARVHDRRFFVPRRGNVVCLAPATKSQSGRVLTPAELHRGAEDQAAPMESIDSSNPTSPHFKCTAASVSLNLALPFFTFGIPYFGLISWQPSSQKTPPSADSGVGMGEFTAISRSASITRSTSEINSAFSFAISHFFSFTR